MKDFGFRKNRKKLWVLLAVLVLTAVLSSMLEGCVRKYGRGDIKAYAEKLTGSDNLSVSDGYVEIQEDEEGYLDHLWTVTDEDRNLVFHVLDDYYWALEEVENQLLNDYDSSAFLWLLENRKIPETEGLFLRKDSKSGLIHAEVLCRFTDRGSLQTLYEELVSLRKAAEKEGFRDLGTLCTVEYDYFLRRAVDYETDEGDTTGSLGKIDEGAYALMTKNFLSCALDYRFDDVLRDFSQEEIDALVHDPASVRIYKFAGDGAEEAASREEASVSGTGEGTGDGSGRSEDRDPSDRIYYEGVIGSPQYAGISFGTLYELLRQEGRPVQGSAWHYSFSSPEGSLIEISYDFNDLSGYNDKDGKLKRGYYYIRDDKKVRMKNYYSNHFDTSEILALTGLRVYEDRPYLVPDPEKGDGE